MKSVERHSTLRFTYFNIYPDHITIFECACKRVGTQVGASGVIRKINRLLRNAENQEDN